MTQSGNWNSMRELPLYHRNGGGTRAERWRMISATWKTIKDVVLSFISDEALTRGAAIAFYTATSIAPVLLIVIAIAGLVFGQEAAQNAITSQFSDLMGHQTAEVLQSAIASAAEKSSGIIATIIGLAVLIATASGVFGEMQAALNAIWKANPQTTTVSQLIRARAGAFWKRFKTFGVCRRGYSSSWYRQCSRERVSLDQAAMHHIHQI
jgi:uncharacterized BrkB/YihY/UPF0761 family membrane protein